MSTIFLKILEEERQNVLHKLTVLDQAIQTYKSGTVNADGASIGSPMYINSVINREPEGIFYKYPGYDSNQHTHTKIMLVLHTENHFLHVREMARIIQVLEDKKDMQEVMRRISPALSTMKRKPGSNLVSVEADGIHFNTFWGCREWLDDNGDIREGHTYNSKEVRHFRRKGAGALQ